jgi:hypothetical protein
MWHVACGKGFRQRIKVKGKRSEAGKLESWKARKFLVGAVSGTVFPLDPSTIQPVDLLRQWKGT